jgi:hypothetical protein
VPFSSGDGDIVGAASMEFTSRATAGEFKRRTLGNVKLQKGENKLKMVVGKVAKQSSLDLRGALLKPVK